MITLNTPLKKLQVLLDATATTTELPLQAAYEEINSRQVANQVDVDGITTGLTAVDIITAPPAGSRRRLSSMSIYNADSVARIVTVRLSNSTTGIEVTRKLISVTLQTGEALYYSQNTGWYCVDVNGNQKSNAPASSGAASTANSIATAGSSQASSIAAAIVPTSINSVSSQASSMAALVPASVSSQASSIAAAIVPASINSVSSQASSMAAQNPNTVSSLQSAASVQSFTSTTWSTVSSATSRVKSSFTW